MPPWKVDRVRAQLRGWTPTGVAVAVTAIAQADEQVKGGGADPGYALEKAVLAIVAARRAGRVIAKWQVRTATGELVPAAVPAE